MTPTVCLPLLIAFPPSLFLTPILLSLPLYQFILLTNYLLSMRRLMSAEHTLKTVCPLKFCSVWSAPKVSNSLTTCTNISHVHVHSKMADETLTPFQTQHIVLNLLRSSPHNIRYKSLTSKYHSTYKLYSPFMLIWHSSFTHKLYFTHVPVFSK